MSPHQNDLVFASEHKLTGNSRSIRDATSKADHSESSGASATSSSDVAEQTTTDSGAVTSLDPSASNTTNSTLLTTLLPPANHDDDHDRTGTIIAVVITITLLAVLIGAAVYIFRRKNKFHAKSPTCFQPIRKRRSSTSDSRRALDGEEDVDKIADAHDDNYGDRRGADDKGRHERDMFTIEDFEDPEEEARGGEEYYYDEVFGHSQFEDETTNNSVRQLYSTAEDHNMEEEMLDFDFETLGIKIGDEKSESSRNV